MEPNGRKGGDGGVGVRGGEQRRGEGGVETTVNLSIHLNTLCACGVKENVSSN